MKLINLSVHQLVDFILREGDIDDRSFNNETMVEGTKLHRLVQNNQDDNYLSEVNLETTIEYNHCLLKIHGRADGIIINDNDVIIDEIKSTNIDLEKFKNENYKWHQGQAIVYAYIYLSNHKNIDKIGIQLTYIHQISKEIKRDLKSFNREQITKIFYGYLEEYFTFENILITKLDNKITSIKKMEFPFVLREGQDEIIDICKNNILNKGISFIEASTGLGKTISTIYGSLLGLKKDKDEKIFYLTPKNSGFESVDKCMNILFNSGLELFSLEINAKEKMCLNKGHNCNPDDCPYTKNYYTKIKSIISETMLQTKHLRSNDIIKIAKKNFVCPFELSLDLSLYADLVVMDYNYVFNPISYLRRFFDTTDYKEHITLLVDETHNLIDRARDMYSTSLSYLSFKKARRSYSKIKYKPLKNILTKLSEDFKLFSKFEGDNLRLENIDEDFIKHLKRYIDVTREFLRIDPKFRNSDNKEFGLDVFKFITIYDFASDGFVYLFKRENDDFKILIKCLDASNFILDTVNKIDSATFFSGTLTPIEYYKESILKSVDYDDYLISSPFDKNNLKIIYNNNISLRYKDREESFKTVVDRIRTFINYRFGNYLIFCPSFSYLNKLKKEFEDYDLYVQKEEMTIKEKTEFLNAFKEDGINSKIGLCVLGGSFSESIDIEGNKIIGVVIIGIGIPSISFENDLIKDYYNNNKKNGYSFAYKNPGINKVMQGVGRLIRDENDKGVALLIDDRYLSNEYFKIFKDKWKNYSVINSDEDLIKELNIFYKKYL